MRTVRVLHVNKCADAADSLKFKPLALPSGACNVLPLNANLGVPFGLQTNFT